MSNLPFLRDSAGRLVTDRLRLRLWVDADRVPFRAMHRDPRVMAHFPCLLFDAESDRLLDGIYGRLASTGLGLWAVERLSDHQFVGFAGIEPMALGGALDGTGELIVRLDPRFWHAGYAAEAARTALWVAFEEHGAARVVATLPARNERGRATAERLGMTRRPDLDFDHPERPPGHPLRPQIVYAIDRADAVAPVPAS